MRLRGDESDSNDEDRESAAIMQHDSVQIGKAVVRDASESDTLSKLSRYETRLDRGLIRDLRELERLQQSRTRTILDPGQVSASQ
jgi:hypothetical protein